jgi:hypothetical protein
VSKSVKIVCVLKKDNTRTPTKTNQEHLLLVRTDTLLRPRTYALQAACICMSGVRGITDEAVCGYRLLWLWSKASESDWHESEANSTAWKLPTAVDRSEACSGPRRRTGLYKETPAGLPPPPPHKSNKKASKHRPDRRPTDQSRSLPCA